MGIDRLVSKPSMAMSYLGLRVGLSDKLVNGQMRKGTCILNVRNQSRSFPDIDATSDTQLRGAEAAFDF